jgi:hypothetical protein
MALPGWSQSVAHNSLFAGGKWVKIETTSTGIHKINYSWLKNIGFLHPENVKLFGSRNEKMSRWNSISADNSPKQIPVLRFTEAGGSESLIFYVQGLVDWNYDPVSKQYYPTRNQSAIGKSYFFLTEDVGTDLVFPLMEQPVGNPDSKTSEYDDFGLWEEENLNLLESGSRWFTALLSGGNILSKSFSFPDRFENEPVLLKLYAAGRSFSSTGMDISLNGNAPGRIIFRPVQSNADADFAAEDSLHITQKLIGSAINISMKYNGTASDQCWFDCATLQLRRSLLYSGIPLNFRDSRTVWKGKVAEFQISGASSGLQLWDITNPLSPSRLNYQLKNNQLTFRFKSDELRSFLLFDPQPLFPGVTKSEDVKNAEIVLAAVPEYLILTPGAFLDQAERLAQFHRTTDGLTASVVTVEAIFNNLSGGYPDVSAIRNFIRNLYWQKNSSGTSSLKYLLLFGKGTCDPVHIPGENNPNWIPTFQSENSLSRINSFVTDDFFGQLDPGVADQTGKLNLGIGRIPAATPYEAKIAVEKIIHYHDAASLGDWRNNITFVGDDEDNNLHVSDSERLSLDVAQKNPEYKTSKIYFDTYPQVLTPEKRYPEVTVAIRRSVQSGSLVVNYIGHASEDGLAHERVLTSKDIDSWSNKDRLPLFVTATCEFSRWDMMVKRSAGERLYFHSAGGAIALLSATRLVYSASNFEINTSFFNHVFDRDQQGTPLRLGDLIRIVKNENRGSINTAKFCLLGDPALRLNYPVNRCVNLEINHQPVEKFSGILSPTSLVTFAGEVRDKDGGKMALFNGNMTAQVFDQPTNKTTLGNGGQPPFTYQVQENKLFEGNVPVRNGLFSYSFVVPKDVNFNKGAGLIRYYVSNNESDGNGSFANIHFNGTENVSTSDRKGPDIRLYLENEKFTEGAKVSLNPLLMVYVVDENGINSSGFGIGHDITLEIDGNAASRVNLNDFYTADAATWKSGAILYLLSELSPGPHSLTFKIWDTSNNSSSVSVRFIASKDLELNSVYNFPNPFSEQTRFVITHNRYDELFEVKLEVMDINGRTIYSDQQLLASRGYEITDLCWNPSLPDPVPSSGVYLYRITLTSRDGEQASKSGRMVFSK